jgi:DNA polymerase sigma
MAAPLLLQSEVLKNMWFPDYSDPTMSDIAGSRPSRSKHRQPSEAAMRRVAQTLEAMLATLVPRNPDKIFADREDLRARLQAHISSAFPQARLALFGSTVTGLCDAKSDVDMSLIVPGLPPHKPRDGAAAKKKRVRKNGNAGDAQTQPESAGGSGTPEGHDAERRSVSEPTGLESAKDSDRLLGDARAALQARDQSSETRAASSEVRAEGSNGEDMGRDDDDQADGDEGEEQDEDLSDNPHAAIIKQLAEVLEPHCDKVQALTKARIPIVKLVDKRTGLAVDIGVNNLLALENSQLIRDYLSIDPRLRDLCFFVKHWAKRRKINDPYRGTLSSYAYVLMVVHFLQTRQPAVLPCLQKLAAASPSCKIIDGFDCTYFRDVRQLGPSPNRQSVAELLVEFMRLMAHEFNYHHAVISVRTAAYLSKQEKQWTESKGRDRHWISIEDPFEVTHDLGRVCDRAALHEVRGEFMRAHRIFCESGDVREVCEAYTDEWRGS